MSIEEFIEASNKAATVDELFQLYKKSMAELGFDRLIFSLMTDHLVIGRRAGHGIILNYPADWMNYYVERNLEVTDPVRHKMFAAPAVFTWKSLVDPRCLTKKQAQTLEMGSEAGLRDGIGIPRRGRRDWRREQLGRRGAGQEHSQLRPAPVAPVLYGIPRARKGA
ncbi:MAG TPA: autoinducer binding domain-containing protein [Bryobacteraceae bacterium]|nr:autoinducer binding domain-containing protein [Bryobacteraceae bacterium]